MVNLYIEFEFLWKKMYDIPLVGLQILASDEKNKNKNKKTQQK